MDAIQRISRTSISWASRRFTTAASIPLGIAAIGFKIAFTNADAPELLQGLERFVLTPIEESSLIAQARAVFLGISFMVLMTILPPAMRVVSRDVSPHGTHITPESAQVHSRATSSGLAQPLHHLLTLFLITQSRATNIPLFLLFQAEYLALDHLNLTSMEIIATSLSFQNTAFFAFGGSNAISSIDLSNAYNGISGYNIGAVGLLTFISNWAGPLWWTSATMLLLSKQNQGNRAEVLKLYLSVLTIFVSCSVLAVMLACTALRTHLFIWTVFSPKFLYCVAWTLGQHLCVNIGFGSFVYWIGSV